MRWFRGFVLVFSLLVGVSVSSGERWACGIRAADQHACLVQCLRRARGGISGHVSPTLGRFEGVGWSTAGQPGTCVPGRYMTLTGDVTIRSGSGWYRVRCWR